MSDNRQVRVTIRVSKDEFDILSDAAMKDDRSISSFVRVSSLLVAKEKFGLASVLAEKERLLNKQIELDEKARRVAQAEEDERIYLETGERVRNETGRRTY